MELTWLDELGNVRRVSGLVRVADFDAAELSDIRAALNAHPWRELVLSMHRTANAAKVARRRRKASARWSDTPGLTLHTRKVIGDWTAVTAVWTPPASVASRAVASKRRGNGGRGNPERKGQ